MGVSMSFNIRLAFATLSILCTFYFGVIHGGPAIKFFFNTHALVLVFLGTLFISIFSTSADRAYSLLKLFKKIITNELENDRTRLIYRIYHFAFFRHHGLEIINYHLQINKEHPFVVESIRLLGDKSITDDDFQKLLTTRVDQMSENFNEDSQTLTALSKYPPAMGLIGATSGMISMMMTIGDGDKGSIGRSMATALIATLWGIALSNFVILPLADLASRMNSENLTSRKMIVDAFEMIKERKDPNLILELMLSYVPIDQRDNVTMSCNSWKNSQLKKGESYEKTSALSA